MWRKPNDTKPSGQIPNASAAVPSKSQVVPSVQPSPAAAPSPSESPARAPLSQTTAPVSVPVPSSTKPSPNTSAALVSSSVSVIGAGLKIRGEITGTSDLLIEGEAEGKIRLVGGRVSVGPNGNVQADVDAREIIIEGAVQGNLKASESLHLGSSSRVQGSVITPRIGIEDGARLRGKVEMVRANETREVAAVVPAPEPAANSAAVRAAVASAEGAPSHV